MEVGKRERTIKGEQGRLVGERGERSKAGAASREKERQDQTCEVDSNFRRKRDYARLSGATTTEIREVNSDDIGHDYDYTLGIPLAN